MSMTEAVTNVDAGEPESFVDVANPLYELWFYFRQNKGALFGLILITVFAFIAIFAPLLAPYDPALVMPESFSLGPLWTENSSVKHWLGTDDLGRDLLSRLIYGSRVSMGVGAMVVLISVFFGAAIGLFAGYWGGIIDTTLMRMMDMIMALPSILLAVVVVAILGPNLLNAVVAVSIVQIPGFVRLVRASVLAEKERDYVVASRTFGASHMRIAVLNIFPNCLAPLIVQAALGFSNGILDTAALGFLGLGAQAPTAEWGTMLADARPFIESAPWLVTLPGLCILCVVLAFNLFGDGLRDTLDPRLRK